MSSTSTPPVHDVQIWAAGLDQPPDVVQALQRTLSGDESSRAERFATTELQRRFVVGRGVLRDILGARLGVPPETIAFTYNAHGKPELAERHRREGVSCSFNVSHSRDVAAYAFTREARLGVDVEVVRAMDDPLGIARRFFAPGEFAQLAASPVASRMETFFSLWTAKEAYIKARGQGISIGLDSFEIELGNDLAPRLLDCRDSDPGEWSFAAFRPQADVRGALALQGAMGRIEQRVWRAAFPSARPRTRA